MIGEMRKKRGLTQKELAGLVGISSRTLQDYEQGRKDVNKAAADTVWKLSQALECGITDIIDLSKI